MEEEESLGTIKGQPGGKRAAQPAPGPTPPDPETPVTKQNTEIAPPPYGRERRANITERDSRHAPPPKKDGQGLKRTEEGRGNRERTGWCRRKAAEEDRLWTSRWRGWTAERERAGAMGKEAVRRMGGMDMGGREPTQSRVDLGSDTTRRTGKRRATPTGSERSEKWQAGGKSSPSRARK